MNKKTQLAICMGLLFSSSTVLAQPTQPIGIDWDGSGGFDTVGALDWSVGSSYSDGAITAGLAYQGNPFDPSDDGAACVGTTACNFDVYTHAALQGYVDDGGNPRGISGLNSAFEWTFISGFTETITAFGSSIEDTGLDQNGHNILNINSTQEFSSAGVTQDNFFFEIYYDDNSATFGDALAGTGYADGQLILSGSALKLASGNFSATQATFEDVDNSGSLSVGDIVITDPNVAGFPYQLLDSFGGDDWSNVDITYYSVVGEGGTTLEADVGTYDSNFFTAPGAFSIITDLVFSTENVDPFLETNPSQSYDTAPGGSSRDLLADISLGDLDADGNKSNGALPQFTQESLDQLGGGPAPTASPGEDILFQTDANQGFRTVQIPNPEPGTLALLGLGLGFLSFGRRRRSRKV